MPEQSKEESKVFKVKCKGRNRCLEEVLKEPVEVHIFVSKVNDNIYLHPGPCKYKQGKEGWELCTASGESGAYCVYYSLSLPHPF